MLVEAAIGDAYGCGFEFVSKEVVNQYGHKLQYRSHPKHQQLIPGSYTDDTQMSLAICEALVDREEPWTEESLADRFVSVFKRDERTGYSSRLYSILKSVNNGKQLLESIDGNSTRSGAAMRAFPIGLIPDEKQVIAVSEIQSRITHNTALAIAAAAASALMTHYFVYDLGPKKDLFKYIAGTVTKPAGMPSWGDPFDEPVGHYGWQSVKGAMTAVTESSTLDELLVRCVSFTGDVDTVATIAMAAASWSKEYDRRIRSNLVNGLENGPFGRDYIIDLDLSLKQRFNLN